MSLTPKGVETLLPTTTSIVKLDPNWGRHPVNCCDIYVEGADIRWTDDSEEYRTLSATVGTRLGDGKVSRYTGDPSALRFIAVSGTPTVRVHKYFGVGHDF